MLTIIFGGSVSLKLRFRFGEIENMIVIASFPRREWTGFVSGLHGGFLLFIWEFDVRFSRTFVLLFKVFECYGFDSKESIRGSLLFVFE